jgi:hypothetical protein
MALPKSGRGSNMPEALDAALAWAEQSWYPEARVLADEIRVLRAERDTPHTRDFVKALQLEALHQRERWGAEHDAGKAPQDWFWLLGYLAGKAVAAAVGGDTEKALHHTISSAAVLLNWHAAIGGVDHSMRPGIEEPRV